MFGVFVVFSCLCVVVVILLLVVVAAVGFVISFFVACCLFFIVLDMFVFGAFVVVRRVRCFFVVVLCVL